jgi:hypothetical protein
MGAGLAEIEAALNSCKLASPKRCKNASVVAKQPAVGAGEFLHKLEIPKFHNQSALVGIEKPVDFRLADWLPKGDAREHFKARRCHLKISARAALFAQICGQGLVFDLASEERNHPVNDPQLETDRGELPAAGEERRDEFYVIERGHGSHFHADLLTIKFAQLFRAARPP